MKIRAAVVFGQFGAVADPLNLPIFRNRLAKAGVETILVQHFDTQKVFDFLHNFPGRAGIFGSSLGAGVAPVMAGYLKDRPIDIVGGFQPSDWDPCLHPVLIKDGLDIITRAVAVPANVKFALCFRNPIAAGTLGLGHGTYVLAPENHFTELHVTKRADMHPGDFGISQDEMYAAAKIHLGF
jgi:hypothetical protein